MKLAIELPPAQADRLRAEAERLGLSVEELARAALTDLLSTPDPEFQAVARRVVTKNRDLYKAPGLMRYLGARGSRRTSPSHP